MKKLVALVLSFICTVVFMGCNLQDTSETSGENNISYSPLICYTATQPSWAKPDLELSQEQAEFIIEVWSNSDWENDITKTEYDYVFRGDNVEVRYCYDEGIFNDVINNKHVVLSDDVREQVNKTVDKFIVLPVID